MLKKLTDASTDDDVFSALEDITPLAHNLDDPLSMPNWIFFQGCMTDGTFKPIK